MSPRLEWMASDVSSRQTTTARSGQVTKTCSCEVSMVGSVVELKMRFQPGHLGRRVIHAGDCEPLNSPKGSGKWQKRWNIRARL